MKKIFNRHHIVPQSRCWARTGENVIMLESNYHDAIHKVFSNDIFPEQIDSLTWLTSNVLLPEIQKELLEWLNARDIHNPEERYQEWALLLPRKYKK